MQPSWLGDFPLRFAELTPLRTAHFGDFAITPYVVTHPSGSPALAFRLETEERLIAYSGDTGWTDTLVEVACDADVFIVECYAYDGSAQHHMNYTTLRGNLSKLRPKRLLLTHLGREMLERLSEVDLEVAQDGQVLEL